ncbi:response regulator, partial [Desulfosarcina sp. OttesenSCG-928-G10]|nr:response regulator [Desulfosarcina sp. OttesenSCG-928-G10]
ESQDDPDTVALDFSVKDTGTGISPEYMGMLFEPFTQADTSSTRKYEGTGLGLSICKQLTRLMRGDIRVESEFGKGSTFFFTIRLTRSHTGITPSTQVPEDIRGLSIMVVDDVVDSRMIMKGMLESLGFNAELMDSGKAAIDRLQYPSLQDRSIDLILMDWRMPDMDGFETSRKIRQELRLSTPIIMMTAFGRETQRIEAEKAGINGFLTKPIYQATLLDAIMDGLGKQGQKDVSRKKSFTTQASIYRKSLKGLHILLVEDNMTNQQVAQATLEKAGMKVTIASNGEEAVDAVRDGSFDAVLMDIQMPKMNGYEATQWIRQLPTGVTLPIVAMTAYAMKEDEEKALEAGMDGYVSKPISQDQLFHTLWRLLHNRLPENPDQPDPDADADAERVADDDPDSPEHSDAHGGPDTAFSLPDRLPGLSIGETIEALGIDADTFSTILAGFGDANAQTGDLLRKAAGQADLLELRQLAHSLKGSAANIGAVKLSQCAAVLEERCTTDTPDAVTPEHIDRCLAEVENALNQVLESIDTVTHRSVPPETSGPPDLRTTDPAMNEELDTLLAELSSAMDQADPEQVSALITAIMAEVQRCGHPDTDFHRLENQIRRYDYDLALETLNAIRTHRESR